VFSRFTHSIDSPDSPWVVVNKVRPLEPADYVPQDLAALTGPPGGAGQRMRAEAAEDFLAMEDALRDEGLSLRVSTAYRSFNFQSGIFNDYRNRWGLARAETFAARPGHSEHQTGLAVDVYTTEECRLRACFAQADAYVWLQDNAAAYGFIERYPEGETAVTGFDFEPWHWRWVGADLAQEMRRTGEHTLEEFFRLAPAPDYAD